MKFKVTSWVDLQNNMAEFRMRECDDNPMVMPGQIELAEISTVAGTLHNFRNCRLIGKSTKYIDNGVLVNPYIYRYDSVEEIVT
ncbi:hypothetical protein [Serratia sp. (in: enterobacteria)]|uniref:hypothetical protein n=1 Tax=Serratia sp. (in: enterobacteria) TaxID=616 RepID=UPI00398972DC